MKNTKWDTWEGMDMETGLRAEGRSDDFIAGARWSWETSMQGLKMYYQMKESFKQVPDTGILGRRFHP